MHFLVSNKEPKADIGKLTFAERKCKKKNKLDLQKLISKGSPHVPLFVNLKESS